MRRERASRSKTTKKPQSTKSSQGKSINKALMEEVTSSEIIEQVFIYAPPTLWDPIVKYYSDNFVNLEVFGSSLITNIEEDYMQNANVKNIITFATTTIELQAITDFAYRLSKLGLPAKALSVAVVLMNNTPHDLLGSLKSTNLNLKAMAATSLSNESLNNIIGHVIENMKPYYTDKPITPITEKATHKNMDLSNTDIHDIKKELERIKTSPLTKSKDIYSTIENIVMDKKDVVRMNEAMNEIPYMQYLDSLSSEISSDLEILLNKGDKSSKERIAEAVKVKLFVAGLKSTETEKLLNTVIERAEARANIESTEYRKAIVEYEELEDLSSEGDISQLISKRELGKKEVTDKIKSYAATIRKIQAPAMLLAYTEDTLHEDLQKTLSRSSGLLTNEMESKMNIALTHFKNSKANAMAKKKEYDDNMKEAVNKASEIIKDLTHIIEVDDILIDKLIEDNEKLRRTGGRPIMIAKSKFEEISSLLIRVPKTGLSSFMQHDNYKDKLIIYAIGNNPSNLLLDSSMPYTDFLKEDWDITNNKIIIPRDADTFILSNVFSKAKAVVSKVKKIIIVADADVNQPIREMLFNEIPISTIWTDGKIDNINTVSNILASIRDINTISRNVIVNRADFTNSGKSRYESMIGAQEHRALVILIPIIPDEELSKPTYKVSTQVLSVITTALNKI